MLVVETRSLPLLKTTEVWFYDGTPLDITGKVLYTQSHVKPVDKVYRLKEFNTLALPLSETEDALLARINRTFRYHIRKGENLRPEYHMLNLETKRDFLLFINSFNEFAAQKKLYRFPAWRAKALVKAGAFTVTLMKQGEAFVSVHGYLHDGYRVRLLTSHPVQRAENENIQGYINKFHHWKDILYFKEKGYSWYDFGGISADGNDGRSYFKHSFGGEHQVFYDFIRCCGVQKWTFYVKNIYEKFF